MSGDLSINIKVLDYWIDRPNNKAYCIYEYIDYKPYPKMSNLMIQESDYYDSKKI